jgi:hypothetical protein
MDTGAVRAARRGAPVGLVHKLRVRATVAAGAGAAGMQRRQLCEHVVPNQTLQDVHVPGHDTVRRFSPDGRLLLCFGRGSNHVAVYDVRTPARAARPDAADREARTTPGAASAAAALAAGRAPPAGVGDGLVPDPAPPAPAPAATDADGAAPSAISLYLSGRTDRGFGHFFSLRYQRTYPEGSEALNKDFCLFTLDSKYVRPSAGWSLGASLAYPLTHTRTHTLTHSHTRTNTFSHSHTLSVSFSLFMYGRHGR